MLTSKKTNHNDFFAVFRAPESTFIQSFFRLSNIKFAELRIVKKKENCTSFEMSQNLYFAAEGIIPILFKICAFCHFDRRAAKWPEVETRRGGS